MLKNPEIKGKTIRCRCEKNSNNCYWTKRRQKQPIETNAISCKGQSSRDGAREGNTMTHCSLKEPSCINILNMAGSSVAMTNSLSCSSCSRLVVSLTVESPFDNQDWINIDFTAPIQRFISWSYPVLNVTEVRDLTRQGPFQQWRVHFDPRAEFTDRLKWSAEIKTENEAESGIQYMEFCPCSINL